MRFSIAMLMCIMVLGLALLVPAAGAMYVEGEPIPDDGQVHILAAEDGAADDSEILYTSAPVSSTGGSCWGYPSFGCDLSGGMIAASPISSWDYCPSRIPVETPVMPAELTAYDARMSKRACDGISCAIQCFPKVCSPNLKSPCIRDRIGCNIGCYSPCSPGYLNGCDLTGIPE